MWLTVFIAACAQCGVTMNDMSHLDGGQQVAGVAGEVGSGLKLKCD